ncbi:MAG: TIGR01777 family oxidoreductase [Crocinitomicaceae bacterium]
MDATTQHILITGGSGFLGQHLSAFFQNSGKTVKILSRNPQKDNEIYWDGKEVGDWISAIEKADVIINLSGKSVNCRYTQKNKDLILRSRIDSTNALCKAIQQAESPPKLWINSSSATTYVHSENQQMTEDEGIIGDDFSMNVCKQWEEAFFSCHLNHSRQVAVRSSIVLGKSGGAFPIMKRLSRFGMGGRQGSGKQFMSWIHIQDFCRAVEFIINHPEIVGPVNVTAPNPIRNKEFMKQLRKSLGIPFGISQPKWMLELGAKIIGTETELLLKSRNVVPERLTESGFQFQFPEAKDAIEYLTDK